MKKSLKKLASPKTKLAAKANVSQNCDTLGWKFKVYESPTGSQALQKCIDELDAAVKQHFKVRVKYLSNTGIRDWKEPQAKKLKGVTGIYEIKFKANGVQHRPLGFFGPNDDEFTILVWATHKQDIYDPNDAISTAERRRNFIKTGGASCVPLQIDGEEFPCAE